MPQLGLRGSFEVGKGRGKGRKERDVGHGRNALPPKKKFLVTLLSHYGSSHV